MSERKLLWAIFAASVALAIFYAYTIPLFGERLIFRVHPTAERALAVGNYFLDASAHPDAYDFALAEQYFDAADALSPKLPTLQHQRARVAFLQGNLSTALARINAEIAAGPAVASSYYVRGLIEGFMGDYRASAKDYETYLKTDKHNWAALNDYAWVLIKDGRYQDALVSLDWGIETWPANPWLLNSKATALFELRRLSEAKKAAELASKAVQNIGENEWLKAYPGNDPLIAREGLEALKTSIQKNMHSISEHEAAHK